MIRYIFRAETWSTQNHRLSRMRFSRCLTTAPTPAGKRTRYDSLWRNVEAWDSADFRQAQYVWLRLFQHLNNMTKKPRNYADLSNIATRWIIERGKSKDDTGHHLDSFIVTQLPRLLMFHKQQRDCNSATRLLEHWYIWYIRKGNQNGPGKLNIRPSDQAYSIVFDTLAQTPWDSRRLEQLQKLVKQVRHNGHVPDVSLWNAALRSIANGSQHQKGIPELIELYMQDFEPNSRTWSALVLAHVRDRDDGGIERAVDLVRRLAANQNGASAVVFNHCIDGLGRMGRAAEAQGLLDELLEAHQAARHPDYKREMEPNDRSYLAVINAWAKSGHDDAGLHAQKLLAEVEQLQGKFRGVRVTPHLVAAVLDCLARQANAGPHVQGLVDSIRLKDESLLSPPAYSIAIRAWAQTDRYEAPERAAQILQRLQTSSRTDLRPNVFTYTGVLQAWVRSNREDSWDNVSKLLEEMWRATASDLRPNVVTYNVLLNAAAQQGNISKARQLVDEMQSNGIRPDAVSYGTLMQAYKNAYVHQGDRGSGKYAEHARDILETMERQVERGNLSALPNNLVYSTVIAALGTSSLVDGAQQADDVFWKWAETVKQGDRSASVRVASAALLAWSRSHDVPAVRHAEAIFGWIIEQKLQPSEKMYVYLLETLCRSQRSNAWERMEDLVNEMTQIKGAHIDPGIYRRLLLATRNSNRPDKAQRCLTLAQNLQKNPSLSDNASRKSFHIGSIHSVLIACRTSPESERDSTILVLRECHDILRNCSADKKAAKTRHLFLDACRRMSVNPRNFGLMPIVT